MNAYKFEGTYIKQFKTDREAFEYASGFYDNRDANVEKSINGVWHYWDCNADNFTGNGWVNPEMPLVVCVNWSYPTSSNAAKFGHSKTGCWTISVNCNGNPPKSLAAYLVRPVAMYYATRMNLPFSRPFIYCHPGDDKKDWFEESQNSLATLAQIQKGE